MPLKAREKQHSVASLVAIDGKALRHKGWQRAWGPGTGASEVGGLKTEAVCAHQAAGTNNETMFIAREPLLVFVYRGTEEYRGSCRTLQSL